ncbi:MAG: anaerobic ribonucleoside-triphosphate reductase activating protein [Kingella oralis]
MNTIWLHYENAPQTPPLRFTREEIVWQEVPNEVSLAFLFSGCPLRCADCHSADSWKAGLGEVLRADDLRARLRRYAGLLTCVLFLGGEWQPENLLALLRVARDEFGLKTCLYTGLERDEVPPMLLPELSFLKTGRWLPERGGLDSPTTNQRFVDLQTGMDLTSLFWRQK